MNAVKNGCHPGHRRRRGAVWAGAIGLLGLVASTAPASPATAAVAAYATGNLVRIDVPGSLGTHVIDVNDAGEATGWYRDAAGEQRIFAYVGGVVTPFDPPDSARNRWAASINNAGAITGYYDTDGQGRVGFVRARNGKVTPFSVPNGFIVMPTSINDGGAVAGSFTGLVNGSFVNGGFIRSAEGRVTVVSVPDDPANSGINAINARGDIAGFFGVSHGYVRARGVLTTFDPAGSTYTYPTGINASATSTGWYSDSTTAAHGFVRTASGALTSFDGPGLVHTFASAINNAGAVAGYGDDAAGRSHGFARLRGASTLVDAPGATDTFVVSINEESDLGGFYVDADGVAHGFVWRFAR